MADLKKNVDEKFCYECGEIIRAKAEICPKCGCRQPAFVVVQRSGIDQALDPGASKSRTTAAVLAIFFGGIGIHKFYLGKPLIGVVYAVFVFTLIPAFLGLVEGIRYLLMSDDEFKIRYISGKLDHLGRIDEECPSLDTHVKCPDCRELIPADAKVCSRCGCRLIPQ